MSLYERITDFTVIFFFVGTKGRKKITKQKWNMNIVHKFINRKGIVRGKYCRNEKNIWIFDEQKDLQFLWVEKFDGFWTKERECNRKNINLQFVVIRNGLFMNVYIK